MSTESSSKGVTRAAVLSPPRWRGARSLELVHQLNDRCLELLSQMAAGRDDAAALDLVSQHRDLWRRLDASARQRAACLPFVLVDIHFTDANWWKCARLVSLRPEVEATAFFPPDIAEVLTNATLMLVWHICQSDSRGALHTVGMSSEVLAVVKGLSAHELSEIAARHASDIAPRWRDAPQLWGKLLAAAESNDPNALADVHLHSKLLFCGGLLANS